MATSTLRDICFDCADPHRVARFWADALGYTVRPPDPADTADDPIALLLSTPQTAACASGSTRCPSRR